MAKAPAQKAMNHKAVWSTASFRAASDQLEDGWGLIDGSKDGEAGARLSGGDGTGEYQFSWIEDTDGGTGSAAITNDPMLASRDRQVRNLNNASPVCRIRRAINLYALCLRWN